MNSDNVTPHWFRISTLSKRRTFPCTILAFIDGGASATSTIFIDHKYLIPSSTKKGPESSCFNRFFELSMLALSKVTDTNYSISGLTKYSKESVHHSMFTCLSIYSSDISNTFHTISTHLIIILNFIICSNIVRQFSYFTFNTINKMFQC